MGLITIFSYSVIKSSICICLGTHEDAIHIVSCGKDTNVSIGNNNKSFMNIEVFDHLTNDMGAEEIDVLKMIIHIEPASDINVARIEKRVLLSLSGERLQEINKILEERFGLQIVVARKGCIVLVMKKVKPDFNFEQNTDILKEFLSELFKMMGFSDEDLSGINMSVDITKGDEMDNAQEFHDKNTGKI